MALPRPSEVEPLRRRFPHFSPQLMEVLEACLQVWVISGGTHVCSVHRALLLMFQ